MLHTSSLSSSGVSVVSWRMLFYSVTNHGRLQGRRIRRTNSATASNKLMLSQQTIQVITVRKRQNTLLWNRLYNGMQHSSAQDAAVSGRQKKLPNFCNYSDIIRKIIWRVFDQTSPTCEISDRLLLPAVSRLFQHCQLKRLCTTARNRSHHEYQHHHELLIGILASIAELFSSPSMKVTSASLKNLFASTC